MTDLPPSIANATIGREADRSSELLALALKAGQAGTFYWNVEANENVWSDELLSLYGLTREQFSGRYEDWIDCLVEEDKARGAEAVKQSLESGAFDFQFRIRRRDSGEVRWIHGRAEVVFDSAGKPLRMLGTNADITDRKRVEAELQAKSDELRRLSEASSVGLTRCSRDGRYISANSAYANLVGLPAEAIIGRKYPEVLGAESASRIRPHIEKVLQGEDVQYEAKVAFPGGERWIHVRLNPEIDRAGEVVGWVASVVDISEQKRVAQLIRQGEERFSKAFHASPSGLVISRKSDGLIQEVNETFLQLLGLKREEVLGRRSTELGVFLDRKAREQALAAFQREGRLRDYEISLKARSGHVRTVLLSADTLETGEEPSILTLVRDVTDRRRMEQALQEADRRKNEFIAVLAHELRNPLAPMLNALEILKLQGSFEGSLGIARDILDRQLHHTVRLIDDLLDLGRVTSGKLELRMQCVELADVVEQALETSRPYVQGHQFTVSLPTQPVVLRGDPVRLAQVFSNLLNNACKYTDRGGGISLTAEVSAAEVTVSVTDQGIGIDQEQLPKVFDMFVQMDPGLSRSQGGLGVGLSLAQALVEMHGGTIAAYSEGVGRGSEFRVRLPLLRKGKEAGNERADPQGGQITVRGRRILVVDDNRDHAQSLAMLLKAEGNQVETAHDGVEALEKIRAFLPEAILLDIGLPKLNGNDVCRAIRSNPRTANAFVVALTGWSQEEDRRKSKDAGFDGHLVKPVDFAILMNVLGSGLAVSGAAFDGSSTASP